jgi:hypothetical protein
MATVAEKDYLIEVLKFVPTTYAIQMDGIGAEIVVGKVPTKAYNYFKKHKINLNDYAHDGSGINQFDVNIPEDCRPFSAGEWFECDNINHSYGLEMSENSEITITTDDNDIVWSHNLDFSDLEDVEVETALEEEIEINSRRGQCIFFGERVEEGNFGSYDLPLTAPFDPERLTLVYNHIEGRSILIGISYNHIPLNPSYDASTEFKAYAFSLTKVK